MGIYGTGAIKVGGICRKEMSKLIQWNYFKSYKNSKSSLTWTNGNTISIEVVNQLKECYIRLDYKITNNNTGEKTKINYKVFIERVPSNLGKGNVMYFICPSTYRRCRILYLTYGSHYFKSREAYRIRIYYDCQLSSKLYVLSERYRTAEAKLEKMYMTNRMKQNTFKGKPTKSSLKVDALDKNINDLDSQSDRFMYLWLGKKMNKLR